MKLEDIKIVEFDPNKRYLFLVNDGITEEEAEPILDSLREFLKDTGVKVMFIGGPFAKEVLIDNV